MRQIRLLQRMSSSIAGSARVVAPVARAPAKQAKASRAVGANAASKLALKVRPHLLFLGWMDNSLVRRELDSLVGVGEGCDGSVGLGWNEVTRRVGSGSAWGIKADRSHVTQAPAVSTADVTLRRAEVV